MRVKVGETITAALDVDLIYDCSYCGRKNLNVGRISASSYTPTFLGMQLNPDARGSSLSSLQDKLARLMEKKDPMRIAEVGFTCTCRKCGRAEPWAQTNFDKLKAWAQKLLPVICVMAPFVLMALCTKAGWEEPLLLLFFAVPFLALLGSYIGIKVYVSKKYTQKLQETFNLPERSLPQVLPHSRDRLKEFMEEEQKNKDAQPEVMNLKTPEPIPAGGWGCSCGRGHAGYVSSCVCGKSKQENMRKEVEK